MFWIVPYPVGQQNHLLLLLLLLLDRAADTAAVGKQKQDTVQQRRQSRHKAPQHTEQLDRTHLGREPQLRPRQDTGEEPGGGKALLAASLD